MEELDTGKEPTEEEIIKEETRKNAEKILEGVTDIQSSLVVLLMEDVVDEHVKKAASIAGGTLMEFYESEHVFKIATPGVLRERDGKSVIEERDSGFTLGFELNGGEALEIRVWGGIRNDSDIDSHRVSSIAKADEYVKKKIPKKITKINWQYRGIIGDEENHNINSMIVYESGDGPTFKQGPLIVDEKEIEAISFFGREYERLDMISEPFLLSARRLSELVVNVSKQ